LSNHGMQPPQVPTLLEKDNWPCKCSSSVNLPEASSTFQTTKTVTIKLNVHYLQRFSWATNIYAQMKKVPLF